jgi:hypothetical protein
MYSSTHKSMVEVTQKGCQMLLDSIDNMHKSNMIMEEKWYRIQENWFQIQDTIFEKKLEYYKSKDKIINETEMNMVKVITS